MEIKGITICSTLLWQPILPVYPFAMAIHSDRWIAQSKKVHIKNLVNSLNTSMLNLQSSIHWVTLKGLPSCPVDFFCWATQSLMPMLQASPSDWLTWVQLLVRCNMKSWCWASTKDFVTAKCFPDAKFILLASKDVYCMLLHQRFVLQLVARQNVALWYW